MSEKMTKDTVPENFTIGLALVDAIPVVFFGLTMILIGLIFKSWIFITGAILCFTAGAAKVLWKIIVATAKKNIWFLFIQMRWMMPLGFLLMIFSLIAGRNEISWSAVIGAVTALPQLIFFLIGLIGMILMGVFAAVLNNSDLKANWIEQLTNGISQIFIFIGVLFILL